ncbi:MAG: hypothetical protein IJK75_01370 [Bacteroidales bacterium]|nr:hypothetical protein [Bacteroidales bacterium]
MTSRSRMTGSRRLVAATLGRIYPYRAAKQQAPGVAATDAGEIPEQVGNDGQAGDDATPVGSGMTDGESIS